MALQLEEDSNGIVNIRTIDDVVTRSLDSGF